MELLFNCHKVIDDKRRKLLKKKINFAIILILSKHRGVAYNYATKM